MSLHPQVLGCLLDCVSDAVLVVDQAGTVLYANRRVASLFGCAREDVVDHSVEDLLPERFRQRHLRERQVFAERGRPRPLGMGLELCALRRDGAEIPVEISLTPLPGGHTAAAIRDITDLKVAQRELVSAREVASSARQAQQRAKLATIDTLRRLLDQLLEDPVT